MSEFMLLHIDLASEVIDQQELSMDFLQEWIGGKGLGTRLLLDEVDPLIDPFDPQNKIIFVTGPLIGTSFPTANRYGILFKSPLTGTYAETYSGGSVAINMRSAGFFGIVIEGRSENPIYLCLAEGVVNFYDAGDLWGKDTFEVETILQQRHGSSAGNSSNVICIGPAGENLVRFACVQNDLYHSAGRCGAGAVMGSKNLKALVFRGNYRTNLQEKPSFKALTREIMKKISNNPQVYGKHGNFQRTGTIGVVDWTNELACFPTRYFTSCQSQFKDNYDAEAMLKILVAHEGCRRCPFPCGKLVKVPDGPFSCKVMGPEYETVAAFGGICDIHDINAIAKINEYCDRMGLDTISAGNLCGLGIEANQRNRLSLEFPANYNDPKGILRVLDDITYRRGIGNFFAEGITRVAQHFQLEDLAMHVKGLEFAGYDPRAFRGFALSYGVAPEGATHLRSCLYATEIHEPDRFSYENKVDKLIEAEDRMAVLDSLIVCKFLRGVLDWDALCHIYSVIFDQPIEIPELRELAGRVITLSREFNIVAGFGRRDDYLPDRVYLEPLFDKHGIEINLDREKYDRMLDEYYSKRGWTQDGIPIIS